MLNYAIAICILLYIAAVILGHALASLHFTIVIIYQHVCDACTMSIVVLNYKP